MLLAFSSVWRVRCHVDYLKLQFCMLSSFSRVFSTEDMARLAGKKLPRSIFDFYSGGAEDEITMRANRTAFEDICLVPRILSVKGAVDTSQTILGSSAKLPIAIAPMGAVGFGRRDGDIAIARAARVAGIPYVLSTTATTSIEHLAEAAGGKLWFQLYALRHREASFRLVDRAKAAGYEALVVTADVPVGGKRERDLRNDFSMPFRFTARNLIDFASRPRWALDMLVNGIPPLPNLAEVVGGDVLPVDAAASVGREFDPTFNWEDLKAIRKRWPGQLILKGVLSVADALLAADAGCNAIIVSNHGGRQLDGAIATMRALPEISGALGERLEILIDGGIRRGSDIAKAVALGATAVLVGRPALYGACVGGEAGVSHVLGILRDELVRSMTLCGVADLASITRELVSARHEK